LGLYFTRKLLTDILHGSIAFKAGKVTDIFNIKIPLDIRSAGQKKRRASHENRVGH
jgi:hypothetical protein